ncbi:hypothetical protein ACFUMH_15170, partial [Cellulomonas sp. NPDC057328]
RTRTPSRAAGDSKVVLPIPGAWTSDDTQRLAPAGQDARLFTGSIDAIARSQAFAGPGQEAIEEREHAASGGVPAVAEPSDAGGGERRPDAAGAQRRPDGPGAADDPDATGVLPPVREGRGPHGPVADRADEGSGAPPSRRSVTRRPRPTGPSAGDGPGGADGQ